MKRITGLNQKTSIADANMYYNEIQNRKDPSILLSGLVRNVKRKRQHTFTEQEDDSTALEYNLKKSRSKRNESNIGDALEIGILTEIRKSNATLNKSKPTVVERESIVINKVHPINMIKENNTEVLISNSESSTFRKLIKDHSNKKSSVLDKSSRISSLYATDTKPKKSIFHNEFTIMYRLKWLFFGIASKIISVLLLITAQFLFGNQINNSVNGFFVFIPWMILIILTVVSILVLIIFKRPNRTIQWTYLSFKVLITFVFDFTIAVLSRFHFLIYFTHATVVFILIQKFLTVFKNNTALVSLSFDFVVVVIFLVLVIVLEAYLHINNMIYSACNIIIFISIFNIKLFALDLPSWNYFEKLPYARVLYEVDKKLIFFKRKNNMQKGFDIRSFAK